MSALLREADPRLVDLAAALREGRLLPYLGAGLHPPGASCPLTPAALAAFLGGKVALPRRARGNLSAAAQHIESQRHRSSLTSLLREAFAAPLPPTPLHQALSRLAPPLIVDTWYDGATRSALAGQSNWGEVQGITRAGIGEDRWYRFYDAKALPATASDAESWTTLLYKPHGGITPAANFLASDADYVEVLTEIDIQTPIPDIVRHRRQGRGFLFIGCRFDDQMLRSYARQILKRSAGPHAALLPVVDLTRNEQRFLLEQNITPLDAEPVAAATDLAALL